MASHTDLPKPKLVTGGCLCGAVRYQVGFPQDWDSVKNTGTCQCTQCRRNSGGLFFVAIEVPKSSFKWIYPRTASEVGRHVGERLGKSGSSFSSPSPKLKSFSATPGIRRCFCADCGGFMLWVDDAKATVELSVGTIDPLYLIGPVGDHEVGRTPAGVDGQAVPDGGYGQLFAGGYGRHLWCDNEIKGVTDGLTICGVGRGQRVATLP